MTKLSVNVNKLATIRNSRGKNTPDVAALARKILGYGVAGLTVHPRPDGRHIRPADVTELNALVQEWNASRSTGIPNDTTTAEFNIEGYPSEDFLQMIELIKPHQCTLVPDPPEALTSNAGWVVHKRECELERALAKLRQLHVRSSIFVDPIDFTDDFVRGLEKLKPDRIELYTENFADSHGSCEGERVLQTYRHAAQTAKTLGIGVNAGHDLNQSNLGVLIAAIPWIDEVSIGHGLICESLEAGLEATVKAYLNILKS